MDAFENKRKIRCASEGGESGSNDGKRGTTPERGSYSVYLDMILHSVKAGGAGRRKNAVKRTTMCCFA
jgi:hypothetical protein